MALNDRLIDLEVMIQEKDKTIDYQGNCILSLKKQNCEDRKAGNLVSVCMSFVMSSCPINIHHILNRLLSGFAFSIAGTRQA